MKIFPQICIVISQSALCIAVILLNNRVHTLERQIQSPLKTVILWQARTNIMWSDMGENDMVIYIAKTNQYIVYPKDYTKE